MAPTGHAFVDWDDTLAENIRFFNEAVADNVRLLSATLGLDPARVEAVGQACDLEVARRTGLTRTSFPSAWVEAYRRLAAEAGRPADPAVARRVWARCAAVYDVRQPLRPGAAAFLAWLREHGFEVAVWTAGDEGVQRRKVEHSGLAGYVDHVYAVPEKTAEALSRFLDGRDPARACVVGNSAASDVAPALACGLLAVHVPAETWGYDVVPLDEGHPRYVRVPALEAVPGVLAAWFGLRREAAP